jgi:hypothetical protein
VEYCSFSTVAETDIAHIISLPVHRSAFVSPVSCVGSEGRAEVEWRDVQKKTERERERERGERKTEVK